jgi:peptidyl-prolyl cis-trans isomerase D
MFDFVRKHTRLALGFFLLLIIPSFVFFGIEGYGKIGDTARATVASVDGVKIAQAEFESVHLQVMQRARQQMQGADPALFDTPEARRNTLDGLVRERTLLAAARHMHLNPSDARLQRLFVSDPQYAAIRNPDGSVNREILASQGMSSDGFAQQLRQQIAVQQVLGGVSATAMAPARIVAATADPLFQRREVQFQRFDVVAYRDKVKPTEAEIEAFYKSRASEFKTAEQAVIDYVVLDLEALGAQADPAEDAVRKFYDDNAARFTAPEERQASHILINADSAQPLAARQAAKAKAEALLAEARKNPAGFAELARKHSQDTGSAGQGGDLGFFGRGAMVKPFEDAAFGMKPGEFAGPVETDFGYHVIQLNGIKGGGKRPFDDVKAEITAELRKTGAQRRWAEAAEQFTNTVYEQSDSLQPVMDRLKLKKQTATVQRKPALGASGPLGSAKLLDAVFGVEALSYKRNTDAIEFGPNQLVAARVVQHTPARLQALTEVADKVREQVVASQAQAMALKEGKARLAALQSPSSGGDAERLPNMATVSRLQPQGLPREVIDAALRADASKLPQVVGVESPDGAYVVLRVAAVLPREAMPGGESSLNRQYTQAWAAAESAAYLTALKRRYKAEIKSDAIGVPAEASAGGKAASAPR